MVRNCAPTLAGIKTGSVFSHSFPDKPALRACVRALNRLLRRRGLLVIPLNFAEGKALVYVYRPAYLERDLKQNAAKRILTGFGYETDCADKCVAVLRRRVQESDRFPHEIGLFLGYPPEDVLGFIENKAANYKYSGLWKVYGDVESAKLTFLRYKLCTDYYCTMLKKGNSLEILAFNE